MKYLSAFALTMMCSSVSLTQNGIAANPSTGTGPLHVSATPYKTYINSRFGYRLNYPPELLVPQGESDNSDGQKFLSKKGDAELAAWGNYKSDDDLDSALKMAKESDSTNGLRKEITYSASGKDWFAISGNIGDKIFYQKTCLRGDTFRTVAFKYPRSAKDQYSQVVDNVVATFKWCKK